MIGNSRTACAVLAAATLALVGLARADEPALRLRAKAARSSAAPLTIEVLRWSTPQEREPLHAALTVAPPPPAAAAPAGAGRAGRGGRGGRGAAPPLSPAARFSAAVRAAPTVGFIWGEGPTGYSIKYAWRDPSSEAPSRVVLVTDRRLESHSPSWPQVPATPADVEFTVLELRLDAKGTGAAKTSLTGSAIVDPAAQALTFEGYDKAPVLLEVTR